MKKTIVSLFLFFIFICANGQYTDYVNPFVGTDFHGHTFPGAAYPFGMVQLSPDTRLDTWDGCSGYHYSDSEIFGFSHTHLSGTGCSDYGDVLFMPVVGYDSMGISNDIYKSHFLHKNEKATPGYYEVLLDKWNVLARLTAGKRIGMHQYTYPSGCRPQLIIDLSHRDILLDSDIQIIDKYTVTGFRSSQEWASDQRVYFYIRFSRPIEESLITDDAYLDKRPTPTHSKVLLTFKKGRKHNILSAKIGISSVSVENARQNLLSEIPSSGDFDLEKLVASTQKAWNEYLGKIDVRSSCTDTEKLRTFYSALYHTAISPNLYSDVNGEYRGMDRKVHRAEGFDRYTVFSLWDTFRALHPLFSIIERERTLDFLKSFQSIYDEGGKLPIWELAGYETNCMIGYNSVSVIADAVAKGIDGFDIPRMLQAMVESSRKREFGLDVFRESGLVLGEKEHESVSKTLEYAYDDWCVAQVAKYLYEHAPKSPESAYYKTTYEQYMRSALYYRNIFDPSTGFMRPRLDGRWLTPFRPDEVNNHFTEANSWQYSFFVPQDIEGHIALLGGDSLYCDKLDRLFSASEKTTGRTQSDITGLIGQYAHGNEPSHHIAYLYNYAGQPWKSQQRVRQIMDELYTSAPDGLCGNEDCGQMSAWYVLSAIGLYPVTPGSDLLVFGSPIFENIVLNLENGKKFIVRAQPSEPIPTASCAEDAAVPTTEDAAIFTSEAAAADAVAFTSEATAADAVALAAMPSGKRWIDLCPYIHSAQLNGRPYARTYLHFSDLIAGGKLDFTLGEEPSLSFATADEERPHSSIYDGGFVLNPVFEMENNIFLDSMEVAINYPGEYESIYYYFGADTDTDTDAGADACADADAGDSAAKSMMLYIKPFVVTDNCTITAIAYDHNGHASFPTTSSLYKIRQDMTISLMNEYNPQYNAGGDEGLIDGKRGGINWRTGGWQGYQDTDFTAVVDLKSERPVSAITAGFCQDARSWIWMPQYVEYYISSDGINYKKVGRVDNTVDAQDYEIQTKDFRMDLSATQPVCRYIKIFAKNFGTIPQWHLGAGGEGFIFIDEIIAE